MFTLVHFKFFMLHMVLSVFGLDNLSNVVKNRGGTTYSLVPVGMTYPLQLRRVNESQNLVKLELLQECFQK